MAYLGKSKTAIGDGIKTTRDGFGFVHYSCSHREWPSRKEARKHFMREHLSYNI